MKELITGVKVKLTKSNKLKVTSPHDKTDFDKPIKEEVLNNDEYSKHVDNTLKNMFLSFDPNNII